MIRQQQSTHQLVGSPKNTSHDESGGCSGDQTTTPRGFNKSRRDFSKLLLGITAAALLTNANACATAASAGAILVLKQGTLLSHKNWKWAALSIVSFVVSLSATILLQGHEIVDADKAYGLKISLWLMGKFLQVFWSVTLALFLLSAWTSSSAIASVEGSTIDASLETSLQQKSKRQ